MRARHVLASDADRAFWNRLLDGARFTELARAQPPVPVSELAVRFRDVDISPRVSDGLVRLADRLGVPVKTVLMAAHVKFLAWASGASDVVAGYEHSGRPELDGATESIGLFLNTVPFRIDVAAAPTWRALVERVYRAEAELLPHRRYPMARMKQDLVTQAPLFETAFNFTHFYRLKELRKLPEFSLIDVRANSETEFVLRAEFSRHFFTDEVKLSLHHHAHVFSPVEVDGFAAAYQRIFAAMLVDVDASHAEALPPSPPRVVGGDATRLLAGTTRLGSARVAGDCDRPVSDAERRVAAIWSNVLAIPVDEIGADDNFFDLGGNSLAAMRVVILLKRQVSLADLMKSRSLRALAARLATASPRDQHPVVRALTQSAQDGAPALVCFPYAGGNAINFQPLADELARLGGVDVYAVELPGHDSATLGVGLCALGDVAALVTDELARLLPGRRLAFWGHCVGSALALETTRRLEAAGRAVDRLFVGGKLFPEPHEAAQSIREVSALSDDEVIDALARETGYVELREVAPDLVVALARVFRHDSLDANRYLASAAAGARLAAPLTVVVAGDDPLTPEHHAAYRRWRAVAPTVALRQIADGGHYFCRTRAETVARIVADELALPARESSHA